MEEGGAALIELVFAFLVVMGVAVWQLVSVKRSLREDREKAARREARGSEAAGGREGS